MQGSGFRVQGFGLRELRVLGFGSLGFCSSELRGHVRTKVLKRAGPHAAAGDITGAADGASEDDCTLGILDVRSGIRGLCGKLTKKPWTYNHKY